MNFSSVRQIKNHLNFLDQFWHHGKILCPGLRKLLFKKSRILWKSFIKRWPPSPPVLLLWNPYSELWPYFWIDMQFWIRDMKSGWSPLPPFVKKFHKIPLFFLRTASLIKTKGSSSVIFQLQSLSAHNQNTNLLKLSLFKYWIWDGGGKPPCCT